MKLYLFLSVLLSFPFISFEQLQSSSFNFDEFLEVVKIVSSRPIDENCISNNISIPPNSIMLSITNSKAFDYITLQHISMDFWNPNLKNCLLSKFVIVCTDKKCMTKCSTITNLTCAMLDLGHTREVSGVVCDPSYSLFIYIKHELMQQALMVTNEIFFFDSDVLIFKNPWISLVYSLDTNGNRVFPPYHIMFQRDFGYTDDCNIGDFNSGQLYIRNSTDVQQYFNNLFKFKQDILSCKDKKNDQDYFPAAVDKLNIKVCGFNKYLFTSICQIYYKLTNDNGYFNDIITFHLSGIVGRMKYHQAFVLLNKVKLSPTITLGNILKTSDFFNKKFDEVEFASVYHEYLLNYNVSLST
jgi:hypothetical protein